jgi:chromosomal replication initiation ATPase DnaA
MEEKRATDFITNRWVPLSLVVDGIAKHYRVDKHEIIKVIKGPAKGSEARKVAMYLCQQLGDHTLEDIQHHLGLTHSGSMSA